VEDLGERTWQWAFGSHKRLGEKLDYGKLVSARIRMSAQMNTKQDLLQFHPAVLSIKGKVVPVL
jgi:hypothetical protein